MKKIVDVIPGKCESPWNRGTRIKAAKLKLTCGHTLYRQIDKDTKFQKARCDECSGKINRDSKFRQNLMKSTFVSSATQESEENTSSSKKEKSSPIRRTTASKPKRNRSSKISVDDALTRLSDEATHQHLGFQSRSDLHDKLKNIQDILSPK